MKLFQENLLHSHKLRDLARVVIVLTSQNRLIPFSANHQNNVAVRGCVISPPPPSPSIVPPHPKGLNSIMQC